jgi:choline dehydrogenase
MQSGADTIVVGAGSAGAIIAARMTEKDANQVLLLEAGPDYPDLTKLPADLINGRRNAMTSHDWGYEHRPSPEALVLSLPRGRVVGGSSAVNTCIALRGQPEDYDEWAAMGLPDWSWELCLPAFKRLEDDRDFGETPWHGRGGPIPVRRHTREELVPWQAAFMDACTSRGLPPSADTNDPTTTGFGPHAMNKIDGVRMSAARGYLTAEVRARKNFTLAPQTLVHRVLFENQRVVGIEVEQAGERRVIATSKVVLSAGALATPALLLRSGIGPAAELARLKVTPVVELAAVGSRMLDHPGVALFFRAGKVSVDRKAPLVQTVFRFTSKDSTVPNDMQVQPGSFVPLPRVILPFFTISVCLGKPRRGGTMRVRSVDPRARIDVDNHFLVDPIDHARTMEAVDHIVALAQEPALREMGTHFWPGKKVVADRARLGDWIRKRNGSGYHPSGTVPMGPEGAADAATDGRGRVRGVHGLIVADASLMPTITSANTNFPTLMIGERFGEWLRDGAI